MTPPQDPLLPVARPNPFLPTITLFDASTLLGVSYTSLCRQWRSLGWIPVFRQSNRLHFYRYAVEEWYLSYRYRSQGRPRLRWLPWSPLDTMRVLGTTKRVALTVPYFTVARRQPDLGRPWQRRYHPPLVREWAENHEHEYHFLNGFTGEHLRQWQAYLDCA